MPDLFHLRELKGDGEAIPEWVLTHRNHPTSPTAEVPLKALPRCGWILQVDYKLITACIYELVHTALLEMGGDEGSNRSTAGNSRSHICHVLSHGLRAPNM